MIHGKYYYQGLTNKGSKITFENAKRHCKKNGGKLAEPDTTQINLGLANLIPPGDGHLWIGIKRFANGTLVYDSNNATIPENLSDNSGTSELTECTSYNTISKEWTYSGCDQKKKGFICERLEEKGDILIFFQSPYVHKLEIFKQKFIV